MSRNKRADVYGHRKGFRGNEERRVMTAKAQQKTAGETGKTVRGDVLRFFREMAPRRLAALLFVAGLLMSLSMPPVGLFFTLWLALPVLYFSLATAENRKQAFARGWFFGAGFFMGGLYWVMFALFVDIAAWWFLVPLALFGIPALLGLYIGVFGILSFKMFKFFSGISSVLMFAVLWCVMEFLRGILFTGFPWNLSGYAWASSLAMMQNLSWAGIYGLSILTILAASLPIILFLEAGPRLRSAALAVSLLLPLSLWTWGSVRLATAEDVGMHDGIMLRIVQPNIPQHEKWLDNKQAEHLRRYFALSALPVEKAALRLFDESEIAALPGLQRRDIFSDSHVAALQLAETNGAVLPDPSPRRSPTYIIWPETAVTADLQTHPELGDYLRSSLPQDSILMTGNIYSRKSEDGQYRYYYNSLLVMDVATGEKSYYDKTHLVPFGEYVPFRNFFSVGALGSVLSGFEDFQRGSGPYTADYFDMPAFSPLICYEAIFPGYVINSRKQRPEWLLNVTNDGWYGKSSGPYQHFAFSRARAIEEGLPMVRAANTGISAVIDPYGRVMGMVPLGEAGILDHALPEALPQTLYGKWREGFFWSAVFLLCGVSAAVRKNGRE
ncbi:MAG: apolipoprotein N-acyltransferase [Micavibrio sp.]|nr:MAG: apolipoprotein N-acyltransferase [Micavibrio sp.]